MSKAYSTELCCRISLNFCDLPMILCCCCHGEEDRKLSLQKGTNTHPWLLTQNLDVIEVSHLWKHENVPHQQRGLFSTVSSGLLPAEAVNQLDLEKVTWIHWVTKAQEDKWLLFISTVQTQYSYHTLWCCAILDFTSEAEVWNWHRHIYLFLSTCLAKVCIFTF